MLMNDLKLDHLIMVCNAWRSPSANDMKGNGRGLRTLRWFCLETIHRKPSWLSVASACLVVIQNNAAAVSTSDEDRPDLRALPLRESNNLVKCRRACTDRCSPSVAESDSLLTQDFSWATFGNFKRNICSTNFRPSGVIGGAVAKLLDVSDDSADDKSEDSQCSSPESKAATEALADYLQIYKGLASKDAQFISRNSPAYVQKIAATAMGPIVGNNEQMVVHNWLLKNGVNELEPFFESIGMNPEKLEDVLSLVQITLTGEQGLLRSTEVLESLGIPRRGLWNVLERNKQLLTLTAAELEAIVEFLEGLGVKRKDMAGLIENSFFVTENLATLQHLEQIGIQKHVIAEILKTDPHVATIDMPVGNFRERMDFLLACGLSESEVEQSLKLFPQLLHLRLENLKRKIQFFDSIGLEREKMAKIIARWPLVFRQSVEKKLRPKIEMLQSLGVGREGIAKILTRYPEITAVSLEDNLKQKVAFFEANGLTGRRLVKLMTSHPRALTLSVNDLNKKLDFFKQKGFVLGSVEMIRALGVCITLSTASLEARFLNLESLGFSLEESREIVKQQPAILTVSEKCIQDKVHYLVNHMNRPVLEITRCPSYLLYSLELRIKPRHRVLSLLKSRRLLREEAYSLNTIMIMSEKKFVERFVLQYPIAAAVYKGGATEALTSKRTE